MASRIPLGDIGTAFELTGEKPASPYARFGTMLPASQQAGARRAAPAPGSGAPAASTTAAPAAGVKTVPAGKPIPWDEVVKLPEMRGLSSDELEQARNEYFLDVVAPQIQTEDLAVAREAFDADTKPGKLSRALNALTDVVRTVRREGPAAAARKSVGVELSTETLDQLERSYRGLKQDVFATDITASRRALAMIDGMDRGEKLETPGARYGVGPSNDPFTVLGIEYQRATPERRAELRQRLEGSYGDDLRTIAKEAGELSGLYQNPNAKEAIEAANTGKWKQAWEAFAADPVGIVKDLTLSNSAQVVPMATMGVAGAAVKGVPGLMLGFAGGSFPVDYAMSLVEYLGEQGIDLRDYKAVDAKLREPGFLDELQNYAAAHATGVAVGDAVAGGLMKPVRGGLLKATKAAAGNVVKGVAGEMGGEAAGEVLATGKVKPGDVIAEGLAAGPMTVAGSTAATIGRPREEAPAAEETPAGPVDAAEVVGAEPAPAARARPRAEGAVATDTGEGDLFNTEGQAAPPAEEKPAKPPEFVRGRKTTFATERGSKLEGELAVADVDELVTSHDSALNENKRYPQDLQPRDRTRDASEIQIARIAQNLQPDFLGESPQASQGAPIVGPDGIVESGNARSIALKRAYDADTEQAKAYREWLLANAESFGLDPQALAGVKRPVLVRIRTTDVNRAEFTRQANESSLAQLSPVETARADAARLKSIDDLVAGENGELSTAGNIAFVRRFVGMLPVTEQSALVTATGELSQAGVTRLRNAVLAKAYGGGDTLMRMVESPDDNIRNITNALVRAAPRVAKAREAIAEGALHDLDITADLLKGVEWLSRLRADKRPVDAWLAQVSFFEAEASPEFKALIKFLDENSRSPRRIAEFIEAYLAGVEAAGNPAQAGMFGGQVPAKTDIIEQAKKGVSGEPDDLRSGEAAAAAPAGEGAEARGGGRGEEVSRPSEPEAKPRQEPEGARGGESGARKDEGTVADEKAAGIVDGSRIVDADAHEAATSPKNDKPEPTKDQIEAGNYEKGHVTIAGLDISIENPEGSRRRPEWPVLKQHYGYVRGTVGFDKDHVDVFLKPGTAEDWSGSVFVVNQNKADGKFDEHKVMLGFDSETSARAAYLENYTKGWESRIASIAELDLDAFKAWVHDKTQKGPKGGALDDEPARGDAAVEVPAGRATVAASRSGEPSVPSKPAPAAAAAPGGERIGDFGEKIGGARKDVWQSLKDTMREAQGVDLLSQPLSKSWPAPDYQALLDGGADPWTVAFMHAARDEVPPKPRMEWKAKRWAEQVKVLRDTAFALTQGELSAERARKTLTEMAGSSRGFQDIIGRIELYQLVGHSKSLEGVRLSSGSYSIHEGKEHNPPKVIWTVEKKAAATAFSNWPRMLATGSTKAEALQNFKEKLDSLTIDEPASKEVSFEIYSKRGEDGYYVGKKIGRNPLLLAGPFKTVKEARAHKDEHRDELLKKLERAKEIPDVRRDTNEPRVGEDMRSGQDVTPQMFAETFGFRGVEFGNWVEQGKRQKDLNDAFDALMDMAAVLNVPPKAISLNGELGLAFGARGTGGVEAAKAHYESGHVVINLTKKDGAGSIGHEWWHALDNYFSRMREKKSDYMTEGMDVSLASRGSPYEHRGQVRKEMVEAFGKLVGAIRSTALRARSSKLDAKRSKDYWTTGREMSARAFESYLISKLQDQNAANDYLANIVSEETWKAAEKLGFELDESYPYHTAGEIPQIRAAFDHFFATVQTKTTDRGSVAMFSRQADRIGEYKLQKKQGRVEPLFWNAHIGLGAPALEHGLDDGARVVMYNVFDAKGRDDNGRPVHIGALRVVLNAAEKFTELRLLEIKSGKRQRGLGWGETVVASLLAHNGPGIPIKVIDIQHHTPDREFDALPFWRKMGVDLVNYSTNPDTQIDGFLTLGRYLRGRRSAGTLAGDEGQATEVRSRAQPPGERGGASSLGEPDAGREEGDRAGRGRALGGDETGEAGVADEGPGYRVSETERGPAARGAKTPDAQLDLFTATPVPGRKSRALEVNEIRVEPATRGILRVGYNKIDTREKAAHAFAALRKSPRERFQVIVTDKSDKPIAAMDLFAGTDTQTSVYPGIVAKAIYQTKGAAKVWFAHNHPSGTTVASQADHLLTRHLRRALDADIGVEFQGHIIIAGQRAAMFTDEGDPFSFDIPPATRKYEIPITERMVRRFGAPGAIINAPSVAREFLRSFDPKTSGLLLLDPMHRVRGWLPMTVAEMAKLRTGDITSGAGKLFGDMGRLSPTTVMAYVPAASSDEVKAAARNIGTALASIDVKLLDAWVQDEGNPEALVSFAERGLDLGDAERPFFRRGAGDGGAETVEARRLAEALTRRWANAPKLHVTKSPDEWPFKAPDDALGAYWRGGLYLAAENHDSPAELEFTVFHESLGHFGLRGFFGKQLDPVLRDLWTRNANLRRAAADWMAKNEKRKDWTDEDFRLQAIEEALADVAGSGRTITGLGKLLAAIQRWLRAHGFEGVADWLEGLSDAEALSVLAEARAFVVKGGAAHVYTPELAAKFSRPGGVFYSELERQIAAVKMPTAPAEQWRAIIRNLKGVKPDEIEWSGVLDWLGLQKGKVTREAVVGYLAANGVRVEEVLLGETGSLSSRVDELTVELDAKGYDIITEPNLETGDPDPVGLTRRSDNMRFDLMGEQDRREDFDASIDDLPEDIGRLAEELRGMARGAQEGHTDARFEQYTLPGGEKYRELLLKLPEAPLDKNPEIAKKRARFQQLVDLEEGPRAQRRELTVDENAERDRLMEELNASGPNPYLDRDRHTFRSVHFNEPNIVAHVRFKERTDTDDRRVLFIEEVQSDWAQKGRRGGFRDDAARKAVVAELEKYGVVPNEATSIASLTRMGVPEDARGRWYDVYMKGGDVPSAPFVQKTDQWAGLVLKRMIAWAAERGFDRVAWTTGEQQADRYDLSKYVHHINWWRTIDGLYDIEAFGKNYDDGASPIIKGDGKSAAELADLIGKEVADRIVEQAKSKKKGSLVNLELKIGGEGMREFYDRILPGVARDVLKKLGGGRVTSVSIPREVEIQQESKANGARWFVSEPGGVNLEVDLPSKEAAERWANEHARVLKQPGFDITPELRESARQGVPMFSRRGARPAGRRESLFNAAVRIPTQLLGVDKLTSWAYDTLLEKVGGIIPEGVKAGVVSDYGLPEAVIDRRAQMQAHMRTGLREVGGELEKLLNLTRAESRVAYAWMNNRDGDALLDELPEPSREVLRGMKARIDALSKEAVRLGQLSADVYDRNAMAYLHRSYRKYELEATKQERAARGRAVRILGDQYKGRGMVDNADMAKMKNAAPEWWGRKLREGRGDRGLRGQKFIRLERRDNRGAAVDTLPGVEPADQLGRLREVAYWPADVAVPARYKGWREDAGTWEVRDTKGGKLVLWRDFTPEERQRMGEIDEVRFAVAKTMQQMIHDTEAGKYLEWLANHHGRKPDQLPRGAQIVDARESLVRTFGRDEWVLMPEGEIPGTRVKKYGKLAGLYVPGPIWNDVRQVVNHRITPLGETYATLLRAWKISKTALSPAVHMNNVMANVVMADWHDVLAQDLARALRVMASPERPSNKALLAAFEDNGGTQGMYVLHELQREQLKPLIDELQREVARSESAGLVNAAGVLQAMLAGRYREAMAAAGSGKVARGAKAAASALMDLYQAEDTVFRLAAFLKAKAEGKSDAEAGKVARRSFLDYQINAPWIQMARATAFPFVSFVYRAAPMMLETYARKPWKLLKLWIVLGGLNALGYMLSGGDEDDERKLLPKEKQGRILGFLPPKLIRMPWNDKHGSPVFMDIRRFVPVGDIFDLGQTHAAIPWSPVALPGGPLAVAIELIANKSQFTGRAITNESDTAREVATKVLNHIYKAVAPNLPFLPGTYSFQAIANAGGGKTDPFGRERDLGQALLSSVGVKVAGYPRDVARMGIRFDFEREKREIGAEIRRLAREHARKGIGREEFDRKKDYQLDKLKALEAETRERVR